VLVHRDVQEELMRELTGGPRLRRYVAAPPDVSQIIRGEIGLIDSGLRIIESPLQISADSVGRQRDRW
jgi:hypothetical protein